MVVPYVFRDFEAGPEAARAFGKGRSVVATIGINDYRSWQRLGNAVNDATGTLDVFTRLGFEQAAKPLLNEAATGAAIDALVQDDLGSLKDDDRLVIFFAGHGHTVTQELGGNVRVKTGYIIPADGDPVGGKRATWIRLDTWLSDIARLPPRHILVIVDACRTGIALSDAVVTKWRDGEPASDSLRELDARRSRRIITSALDDQRARDSGPLPGHSLFTGFLIEGLTRDLGRHGRTFATGTELGLYLQQQVRSYRLSGQTPDFGTLELDDRGEMILPLLRPLEAPPPAPPPPEPPPADPAPEPVATPAHPDPAPVQEQEQRRRFIRPITFVAGAMSILVVLVVIGILVPPTFHPRIPDAVSGSSDGSSNPVSGPDQIRGRNPFLERNQLHVMSHPVRRDEYAALRDPPGVGAGNEPVQLGFQDAADLCVRLDAHLPDESECAVVQSVSPHTQVWGALGTNGLVLICNDHDSPSFATSDSKPKNVGVQCVY